jgi:F420H(2)-dependent quinone reductase
LVDAACVIVSIVRTRSHVTESSLLGRFDRWLYRSARPNRLARLMNRISAIHFASGVLAPSNWVTLEVRGRRSGRTISFPLVVADYEGDRYVVAMLGQNANWVRNVRAAGGRAVLRHGRRERVRLEEVDPAVRAPILHRYLALRPQVAGHMCRWTVAPRWRSSSGSLHRYLSSALRPIRQPRATSAGSPGDRGRKRWASKA